MKARPSTAARVAPIALSWLMLAAAAGCAGARVTVTAPRAAYPISMSDCVRDDSGRLYERRELQTVGKLQTEATRVGFLDSALTAASSVDISDTVNAQVAAAQGEAVVDLDVTVTEGCSVLNEFPGLNALPIWPGCVPITVTGDIVRRRPAARPPRPGPATQVARAGR
jgi:hypothetical protein